ncbi:MAG: 4Fe-4S binding protein [Candidatus Lokiarchaeota archaeon]|nr:4Fe-4S binding protein [Candidatus Lokiarchaeota archaeon]
MITQTEIFPFDYTFAVPMFLIWAMTFILVMLLIDTEMLTKKLNLLILLITLVLGGIVLGGIPNAVMPIQQLLGVFVGGGTILSLVAVIIILGILLGSSIVAGRLFCGFACPLGALQELISKVNFKSNLKAHERVKYRINVSQKIISIIRRIFLGVILVLAGFWGILILNVFNPLSGFSFYKTIFTFTFVIPFIGLIVISIASIFLYRPWCRFLCPFGALSALTSRLSRNKYERTEACTECGLCEKVCPTQEAFTNSKKTECYYCNRCIEICPVNAIKFSMDL